MNDSFEISVKYKGKELSFPASLVVTGYTYKINVNVFDILVAFERDDENNFRALVRNEDLQHESNIDRLLISEIGNKIVLLFKDE